MIWKVDTPRIVYYRESLLPAWFIQGVTVDSGELFSKTLKESPFLSRGSEAKMNYACRTLLTKNILDFA
jgi:hypothetical protein